MQGDLNKEMKRLSGLKQNKTKSDAFLEHEAKLNLWKRQINIADKFQNKTDKELAKKLFDDYVENYVFDNFSDLNTLADLVFEEVIKDGLQKQIQKITSDESNNFFPEKTIKSLQDVETRVLDLKQKLGINKEENQDDLTRLQKLEKKFKKHYLLNRNEYTFTCIAQDSLVLMADFTSKKIQDINIGDDIFGLVQDNYTWRLKKQKVLNKVYKGVQKTITIKADNNRLSLTPDHRILAQIGKYEDKREIIYFPAEKTNNRAVYCFNYIKDIHNYYKGILLGFLDSDGYVKKPKHKKWQFTPAYCLSQNNEVESIDWILNYFKFTFNKKWKYGGFKNGAFEYYISTQHTEQIKTFYKELLNNKDIQYGYFCGFLLGDGSLDKYNAWNITQSLRANHKKCLFLRKLLKKLDISFSENIQCDGEILNIRTGSLRLPLNCPKSKKIEKWMSAIETLKPFYSLDKRKIKILKTTYNKPVWDLTTDTENFIVNGFVVHNCPDCNKMTLLRRRTKDFDILIHPFFSGRFYYNRRGMELVKQGIWTKEQYAWVFFTSVDYVNWCIEHEAEIPDLDELDGESFEEFIEKVSYLKKPKIPENIKNETNTK